MLRIGSALLMLAMTGCAGEAADEDVGASDEAVIGGTETFEHPEVGMLVNNGTSYCTATLIRPNVILSAAHCLPGTPKDEARTGFTFRIKTSATATTVFQIDRAYAVPVASDFDGSQKWRAQDISLFRLTQDVPATLARPLKVATGKPWWGSKVAIYGYGCTSRTIDPTTGKRPGGQTKRKKEYDWSLGLVFGFSDTQNTCPGDSGGPLLDIAGGAVFGTTSGYVGGDDAFGDVPKNQQIVNSIADRWATK